MVMSVAQTLPRFLLPRLSWTSTITSSSGFPGASVLWFQQVRDSTKWQQSPPQRRSLYTETRGINSKSLPPRSSLSSIAGGPSFHFRRSFHASAPRSRDHHFDTLKFVQRLQDEGFTEEQSVAMMKVLNDVIEERSATPPPPLLLFFPSILFPSN